MSKSKLSAQQIRAEMSKIGAIQRQRPGRRPSPSDVLGIDVFDERVDLESGFPPAPYKRKYRDARDGCGGNCMGGDDFDVKKPDAKCTNWIKFKSRSTGQEFEYESKKTGVYDMAFQKANDVFDVTFRSTCSDFSKNADTKIENGGKKLRLEDETDGDYTDLIIVCTEGIFAGRYQGKGEKNLTYTTGPVVDCPPGCECNQATGNCEKGGCSSDADCPPGQICVDGNCVDGCRSDDDCPDGHICENGKCVPGCRTDEDCPPGQICVDGQCKAGCRDDNDCAEGLHCVNGECVDRCPDNMVWDGNKCICGNGYIEVDGVCKEQCPPTPPTGGDGECNDEGDPCYGVYCLPPRVCVNGSCECPSGTVDAGNGLCISDDPCLTTLCPPNSTCDGETGNCVCDDGYVLDGETGYCVMAETPDCMEETEDCCPSNATIQIKAGRGLGGGGSFRLNQPCDKTIMLYVDSSAESDKDDLCEEGAGGGHVCNCTAEIAKLMDMIVDLSAELEKIKADAEKCATKNDC